MITTCNLLILSYARYIIQETIISVNSHIEMAFMLILLIYCSYKSYISDKNIFLRQNGIVGSEGMWIRKISLELKSQEAVIEIIAQLF
jgi:hypothetical protein